MISLGLPSSLEDAGLEEGVLEDVSLEDEGLEELKEESALSEVEGISGFELTGFEEHAEKLVSKINIANKIDILFITRLLIKIIYKYSYK